MTKLKAFALRQPFIFGLALIVIYALLSTLTYPAHFLFPESEAGQVLGDALAKAIMFGVFVLALWRLGWLRASRITSLGRAVTWLIVILLAIYLVAGELFAFTAGLSVGSFQPALVTAYAVDGLTTGLVEETMFRGLVLVAMIIAWGETKEGQVWAIVLSSLMFSVMHMFNLLVRPVGIVLLQAVVVALPGILYAALALTYKSLWPAILLHGLTNAAVNIRVSATEGYEETVTMWLIFAAIMIPLMAFSVYLIRRLPDRYELEGARRAIARGSSGA